MMVLDSEEDQRNMQYTATANAMATAMATAKAKATVNRWLLLSVCTN